MGGHGVQTHDVCIDAEQRYVVKRYRSWARAEPEREWAALSLLAKFAPALAPRPIQCFRQDVPPRIVMSLIPGVALGTDSGVSTASTAALADALLQLWASVPSEALTGVRWGPENPTRFVQQVRTDVHRVTRFHQDPVIQEAWELARTWLASGVLDALQERLNPPVLGQGDSNLSNFLWDGRRIRLVDFEDAGPSERSFELANLIEHLSARPYPEIGGEPFLRRFAFTQTEWVRFQEFRRLTAVFWLAMLTPGGRAASRNPAAALHDQAVHVRALLRS